MLHGTFVMQHDCYHPNICSITQICFMSVVLTRSTCNKNGCMNKMVRSNLFHSLPPKLGVFAFNNATLENTAFGAHSEM